MNTQIKDLIVFDIGGTWFRSGLYSNNKIIEFVKAPSVNYVNFPHKNVHTLQQELIFYIKNEVNRLEKKYKNKKITHISVSMGAALNSHTGYVFNSGPLWGPDSKPFNIKAKLKKTLPNYNISIINDVSAALLREVSRKKFNKYKKVMLVTISTGIACRIINTRPASIPTDKMYGIQGEIGHLTITFSFNKTLLEWDCDCGGKNHLNAFCSGRGIEKIFKTFGQGKISSDNFLQYLHKENKIAKEILKSVIKPIAELLITIFTIDPEIEKVIFTGGVVHKLGKDYLNELINILESKGMYQITNHDPRFFRKRISIGIDDDKSGLFGAALGVSI